MITADFFYFPELLGFSNSYLKNSAINENLQYTCIVITCLSLPVLLTFLIFALIFINFLEPVG